MHKFLCDIGGFFGPAPEGELFIRWIQNGIFQPRFSIHSTNTDNTVTEPWMYSDLKDDIRKAIEFRYQLSPYLYSLTDRAHRTGLPIMEPMCSAFQNDVNCYEEGVDFMFGDSLLVANVVEKGAKTRRVYLPKGDTFYDFYTREAYEGGQTIEIPVSLSSIPLFIKSGAVVPMAANRMTNLAMLWCRCADWFSDFCQYRCGERASAKYRCNTSVCQLRTYIIMVFVYRYRACLKCRASAEKILTTGGPTT